MPKERYPFPTMNGNYWVAWGEQNSWYIRYRESYRGGYAYHSSMSPPNPRQPRVTLTMFQISATISRKYILGPIVFSLPNTRTRIQHVFLLRLAGTTSWRRWDIFPTTFHRLYVRGLVLNQTPTRVFGLGRERRLFLSVWSRDQASQRTVVHTAHRNAT